MAEENNWCAAKELCICKLLLQTLDIFVQFAKVVSMQFVAKYARMRQYCITQHAKYSSRGSTKYKSTKSTNNILDNVSP
jgi:hypothetical protein